MIFAGSVLDSEEGTEIHNIAKIFLVGQRIQELSQKARRKNENNNTKRNK